MADILLVDDDKNVRLTLSAFLTKMGNNVENASDGEEAETKIKGFSSGSLLSIVN